MYDVCFTGHRPKDLGGYFETSPLNAYVKARLGEEIQICAAVGYQTFVTGMALGVDQWAAEHVLKLKKRGAPISLIAAIPHDGQDAPWPTAARKKYKELLKGADEVHVISPGPYEPWKMQKRNEWMVDNTERVMAVWNGKKEGGTYNCLKYAWEKKKQLILIDPTEMKTK